MLLPFFTTKVLELWLVATPWLSSKDTIVAKESSL